MNKNKKNEDQVLDILGGIFFLFCCLFIYKIGLHVFIISFLLLIPFWHIIFISFSLNKYVEKALSIGIFFLLLSLYDFFDLNVSDLMRKHGVLRDMQSNQSWDKYFLSLLNPFIYFKFFSQAFLLSPLIYAFFAGEDERPGAKLMREINSQGKRFKKKHIKKINKKDAVQKDGTNLGVDNKGKIISMSDKSANTHTLILGTTGSGKTVSLLNIVESAIKRGLPVVFVDGKGDEKLGRKIVEFAKEYDRPSYLFSKEVKSCFYNPLYTGSFTSKKDRIMGLNEWTEPYYKRRAEEYVQSIFKVLDKCKVNSDLIETVDYMNAGALAKLIRETELTDKEKDKLSVLVKKIKELEKDSDGAVAELRNFMNSDMGELFETKDKPEKDILILEKALEENAIVYFSLPSMEGKEASSMLGKLVINDLKAVINKRKNEYGDSKKFYAIFDEFSVFAGEQVLNILNMGRSGGVCGVVSTQTTADLAGSVSRGGESFISRVISNCNNYIIHRLNDPKVAEEIANVAGTHDVAEITGKIIKEDFGDEGSIKAVKQYKIHPDQIKELPMGQAIFLSKSPYLLKEIVVRHSVIDR